MSDILDKIGLSIMKTQEQSLDLLEKLIATARPNAVFGHPITGGEYTVINVAEVSCGMGVGFGGGDSSATQTEPAAEAITIEGEAPESKVAAANNYGVGGGGGGFSTARPVAAISIGPDGVHVEPVVDVTKIGLAFFTTLGAMALMVSKIQQSSKGH